jgi:hypothetical protein
VITSISVYFEDGKAAGRDSEGHLANNNDDKRAATKCRHPFIE